MTSRSPVPAKSGGEKPETSPETSPETLPETLPETSPETRQPLTWQAVALSIAIVALWGANPVATQFSVEELPPFAVAGARFVLASLFMAVWCLVSRAPLRVSRDQMAPVVGCGLLLFLQIGTFTYGVARSSASHTTLLINCFPLGVVLLEHFVTRADRLTARRLSGIAVALTGCLIVATQASSAGRDPSSLQGDAILLLSAVVLAVKVVYTRYAVRRVPTGTLIFWHDVIGCLLLAAVSFGAEQVRSDAWTTTVCLSLLYQGVLVGGLCFAVQAHLLRRYSATQISMFSFATPLFGLAAASWLRQDPLTIWIALSCGLIIAGVWLVNR